MIKRAEELRRQIVSGLRGGKGDIEMIHVLDNEKGEFGDKGRLFAKLTLKPGVSVGWHQHVGDAETYYILSGEGVVNDNGQETVVKAGDMVWTRDGEHHSLANNGDEDLVLMALILYTSKGCCE